MIEIVEEEFRGCKDTEEMLKRQVYAVVERVKNTDAVEFLNNDVLDIQRTQTLVNGKWESLRYEFCIAYGGPGIWLNTEGLIKGYWWGEKFVIKCDDKDFLEKLQEMEDFLNETCIA